MSLRVISRVCGSIAATRSGVKACCMRALTRVCFGGSSRKQRVDLRLFLRARHRLGALEGRGECPEVSENRIAIGPLQESEHADRLNAADRSLGAQLGQQPVALTGEIGVADVDSRQRVESGRDWVGRSSRYTLLSFRH